MEKVIENLLKSNPWTEYRTRLDLLEEPPESAEVKRARADMLNHPLLLALINELQEWPGKVLNSHKSSGQLFHKLSFLADLGINVGDRDMSNIIGQVMKNTSDEGVFQLPMNIPVHFGGSGKDQFAWALCDAPVLVYCLAKMGLKKDDRVMAAKKFLACYCRDNGFPCTVSKELGKFRGPGRKQDPCPYATQVMLKLLNLFDEERESARIKILVESLLNLWEQSKVLHPYMFFMGTDFRKLKAPFIWYDILHVADTLSGVQGIHNDQRFLEMVELIRLKADTDGFYTPESEWKAWKDWDFGQKKKPSPWLTFLVYRILKRTNQDYF